jgi:hypothetical protein
MIRFWFRELAGWALVLLGLWICFIAMGLMLRPAPGPEAIFEGPPVLIIGAIIFRGGIHLLKVAVAARVCMATQAEPPKPTVPEKRRAKIDTPWDW